MKRLILPILLGLGLLPFVTNNRSIQKVSSEAIIEEGRYFIINEMNTYGFKSNGTTPTSNTEAVEVLSKPFTFTNIEDNKYTISYVENDVTYYLSRRVKTSGDVVCISNPDDNQKTWTITQNGDYFNLSTTIEGDVRLLNFYTFSNGNYFEVRKSNLMDSGHYPNIQLVSIESSTSGLVSKIANIPCDNPTDSQRDEAWGEAKTEFSKITSTPVINFLKTAKADKDADTSTIDWALSKYDYVRNKYHYDGDDNFLNRSDVDYHIFDIAPIQNNEVGVNAIIIVAIVSSISILGFLLFKKKQK